MAAQLETAEFMKARIFLPADVRCNTCCHEMQKGAKLISLKQAVDGETYMGIPIYRFLFKCSSCSSMIKIMQDLKNARYVAEAGATLFNVVDEVAAKEKENLEYISSIHRVTFDELMADLEEMRFRRQKAENQSQDSKSEEV